MLFVVCRRPTTIASQVLLQQHLAKAEAHNKCLCDVTGEDDIDSRGDEVITSYILAHERNEHEAFIKPT